MCVCVCVTNHCAVFLKLMHGRSTILQLLKKPKNWQKFAEHISDKELMSILVKIKGKGEDEMVR